MIARLSLSAILLLAGLGIAAAQQQANDPNQQAPANPQGDGPFKSQQGGKEEPGSHSSGQPTNTADCGPQSNVSRTAPRCCS